ncbi:MAG: hypothetical protein Q7T71_15375, partial [Herbiconiux sp.]|nr:hypothetical protein [Herbiconiux sp.]
MSLDLIAPLALLALIDSTSFGTLVIPIWLMLAPGRIRPARVVAFVVTVGVFYLALGMLLLGGVRTLGTLVDGGLEAVLAAPPVRWAEVALGVGLLVFSFWIDSPKRRARQRASGGAPGRLQRWRERAMGTSVALSAPDPSGSPVTSVAPTTSVAPSTGLASLLALALV